MFYKFFIAAFFFVFPNSSVMATEVYARLLNDSSWGIFIEGKSHEIISFELDGNARDVNIVEKHRRECNSQVVDEVVVNSNSSNGDSGEVYFYKIAISSSGIVIFFDVSTLSLNKKNGLQSSQSDICDYIDSDLNLNILYKKKINTLKSPLLLERFKDSQRKWLAYRDAACLYESTDFNYESDAPYMKAVGQTCISKITLDRNKYIETI
ncbi:Uncharacterized protein conserved in bacteria [Plesiomonas shigelloides]|nr:Uncharacterized protein conserved in bacteria [Plesiomonas shigelloides]